MEATRKNSPFSPTRLGLSTALAVASMLALNAHAAPASVNVTHGGVTYEIGSQPMTYSSNVSLFEAQPWWNNISLATSLAALVRDQLGTPNFHTMAPFFGYGLIAPDRVSALYNNTGLDYVPINPAQAGSYWWMYLIGIVGPSGPTIPDLASYTQTLMTAGGGVSMAGANMPNLTLEGAHHRTLLDSGLTHAVEDGFGMWATADVAHYDSSDSDMKITEVGLYKDVQTARIGIGVGQLWNRQGLMYDGYATYKGQYLLAEVDNKFSTRLQGSITAYYGNFDTKVSRDYEIGTGIDTSVGKTDIASTAVRVRVDMPDLTSIGNMSLSPYAAYTWSRAKVDAYTESGGSFPASYNGNSSTSNTVRVGLGGKTALSATTKLVLNAEAVHSTDDNTSSISGEIIGLSTFSVAGQSVKQNWVRLMADVDHQLGDNSLISFGLNAGTEGNDPSYGGTISYRAAF